jgi:hypothetical protein
MPLRGSRYPFLRLRSMDAQNNGSELSRHVVRAAGSSPVAACRATGKEMPKRMGRRVPRAYHGVAAASVGEPSRGRLSEKSRSNRMKRYILVAKCMLATICCVSLNQNQSFRTAWGVCYNLSVMICSCARVKIRRQDVRGDLSGVSL